MPTNPFTDYTGSPNVIADVDDFTAALQNELNETNRYLLYPVASSQNFKPGLYPGLYLDGTSGANDSLYKQLIERGVYDIKGEKPLNFNNEIFFVSNTAQFMSALKHHVQEYPYVINIKRDQYKKIVGVGNPVIKGDFAKWIRSNTYIEGCTFLEDNSFYFPLGAGSVTVPFPTTIYFYSADKRNLAVSAGDLLYVRGAVFTDGLSNMRVIVDPEHSGALEFVINGSNVLTSGNFDSCFYLKRNIIFKNCTFYGHWTCRNTFNLKFYDCNFINDGDGHAGGLSFVPFDDHASYADIWLPVVKNCLFTVGNTSGLTRGMMEFDGAICNPILKGNHIINLTALDLFALGVDVMTFGATYDLVASGIMTDNTFGGAVASPFSNRLNVPVGSPPIVTDPPGYTFRLWHGGSTLTPNDIQNIWNTTIA